MTNTVTVPRDVRQWEFYPIVMPLTKSGEGPASVGEIETLTWDVWDRYHQSHAAFDNLPDAINDCLSRIALAAAPKAEPVSATDDLIDGFAAALKSKLNKAAEKYGYNDDWMRPEWREDLVRHLIAHVEKGDPRDVAAYCAFAWHHGWSVKPEAPKVEQEPVAWRYRTAQHRQWQFTSSPMDAGYEEADGSEVQSLYTHPASSSDKLLEAIAEECKRGAAGTTTQALGALSNVEALVCEYIAKHKESQS